MENIPFLSSGDDDPSNKESYDDSEDEKEKEKKSKKRPKKSLFFDLEALKKDKEAAKDEEKRFFKDSKETNGIFLSGVVEKQDNGNNNDSEKVDEVGISSKKTIDNQEELSDIDKDKKNQLEHIPPTEKEEYKDEKGAIQGMQESADLPVDEGREEPFRAAEKAKDEALESIRSKVAEQDQDQEVVVLEQESVSKNMVDSNKDSFAETSTEEILNDLPEPLDEDEVISTRSAGSLDMGIPTVADVEPPKYETKNKDLEPMNELYYRERNSGSVLLGGVLGYLIGKRRGRKKTEAKLQPKIDNQESQLNYFKAKLDENEQQIREKTQVANKLKAELAEDLPAMSANEEKKQLEQLEEEFGNSLIEESIGNSAESNGVNQELGLDIKQGAVAEKINDIVQTEELTEAKQETTQKVEYVLEKKKREIENLEDNLESEIEIEHYRDPKTMTLTQLLEVADKISLDTVSLREMYKKNTIDVVNLRRVVSEYVRGGNYQDLLKGSLEAVEMKSALKREIKREDDPIFGTPEKKNTTNIKEPIFEEQQILSRENDLGQKTTLPLVVKEEEGLVEKDEHHSALGVSPITAIAIGIVLALFIMVVMLALVI